MTKYEHVITLFPSKFKSIDIEYDTVTKEVLTPFKLIEIPFETEAESYEESVHKALIQGHEYVREFNRAGIFCAMFIGRK
jgi:hypothetical protein